MVIDELVARIGDLEKRLANICRIGQVEAVDAATGRLDVGFEEGLTVQNIPFLTTRAGEDKTYWLPSVGELGMLFSPSGDLANAWFVPGIFYTGFPIPDTMNAAVAKRIFRDGTEEEVDTDAHSWKLSSGDSERFVDQTKVEDKHGTSINKIDASETKIERSEGSIKIDGSETALERAAGAIKAVVGANTLEISAILANILGAQLFASGVTTFMCPVGPVLFAPAPSPPAAPAPPAGSNPDPEGKATQTPPSTISDVTWQGGMLSFTIPPLTVTVTGTAGPYPIVATAATVATPVQLQMTGSGITLVFPSQGL